MSPLPDFPTVFPRRSRFFRCPYLILQLHDPAREMLINSEPEPAPSSNLKYHLIVLFSVLGLITSWTLNQVFLKRTTNDIPDYPIFFNLLRVLVLEVRFNTVIVPNTFYYPYQS
jgi:hypothetical protein